MPQIKVGQFLLRWRRQAWLGIAAIAVALWLAWSIVANTAADNLAETDPESALAWRSAAAPALVALADEKLTEDLSSEDAMEIRTLAQQALRATPLEEEALGLLGLLAQIDGDEEQADRLMRLAGERSWRDGFVQVWSFHRRAGLGDFEEALAHADALLRSRSYLRGEIGPTLVAFAVDPEAKSALVEALSENPPWRRWYLGELARQTHDPGIAYAVYADLADLGSPPTNGEILAYLDNLIGVGKFAQAYLTWINFLPPERRRSISYAYNGDFEQAPSGLPFDWMIRPITGASTEVVDTGDDDIGHAVRIEFANRRVRYRHLHKLLMLPPGNYRLDGQARTQALDNERGLIWRLACAELDKQTLGATEPVKGTLDWHRFSVSFSVPQTGCRAQWLLLELPAKAALEEEIGGVAWFDDLLVTRAEPGGESLSAAD